MKAFWWNGGDELDRPSELRKRCYVNMQYCLDCFLGFVFEVIITELNCKV